MSIGMRRVEVSAVLCCVELCSIKLCCVEMCWVELFCIELCWVELLFCVELCWLSRDASSCAVSRSAAVS